VPFISAIGVECVYAICYAMQCAIYTLFLIYPKSVRQPVSLSQACFIIMYYMLYYIFFYPIKSPQHLAHAAPTFPALPMGR
jgi:hypothetical protein